MENKTLMTDYYELTMAKTYFDEGDKDKVMYFDIFFRQNPMNGGYTVAAGIDEIIDYVNNLKFSEEDIDYLRSTGDFNEEFLNYLKDFKFTGSIYAVPDGTPVFPNEPVITVKAKAIEAQILETALLACFNHAALVATAAKRITDEAVIDGKKIPVMEFGARRARGIDSAIEASKYGVMGGCVATSNTYAGKKYDIPVSGTMAHSLVTNSANEYEAFLKYAKANPNNCIFLVDTYDTLRSGIPAAIKVARDYLVPNGYKFKGIRIDSGDLAYLSKEARKLLNEAGFTDTKICLSNGLNEYTIRDLVKEGAKFDSLGVGDNIAASKERLGGVYKLVAVEEQGNLIPKIKVSEDSIKTINPGYKKVYRFYDKKTGYALGDVIALHNEKINKKEYTLVCPTDEWKKTTLRDYELKELLVPIYLNGEQVYHNPTVQERREYCKEEFKTLYPEIKRLDTPHEYYVDLSIKLLNLKKELITKYRGNINNGYTKKL
jgi:nicotinate phosphoribosyltransferase